jgi:hypothetical protein
LTPVYLAKDKRSADSQLCASPTLCSLAAILHQVFAVSPEGQYIVNLLENVHKLLPYGMMRQTLRMANAATMINGMVKLLLGKLSVGSVSNWLGMTSYADEGMNLLQRSVNPPGEEHREARQAAGETVDNVLTRR